MTEPVSRQSSSAYDLQSQYEAARYDEVSQSCQPPPNSTQLSDGSEMMSLAEPGSSALAEHYKPSNHSFLEAQNATPEPAGASGPDCFEAVEDSALACGSALLNAAEVRHSRSPFDLGQALLSAYSCFDKVDDAIGACSD
jgi:hypothetical protein